MDPITIIGAVAAVAQLVGLAANLGMQAYRLLRDIKKVPKKSRELCDEIYDLSSVINELYYTLKTVENANTAVVDSISVDFLEKHSHFLTELTSRIQVDKTEIKNRLRWPLSTKENEEWIQKVQRHKSTLALALQNVDLKLGSTHMYFP